MRPQDRTRAIALSGLSSTAKLVAVMLADCCNSADSGWPSVPTLGDRCSLNERTVRRVLAEAEADGWIQRQDRRGTSSIFRLNLSALPAKSASETPGTRSAPDREASPDRGSAPDPDQPRIVDPPTPDPQSPHPGSWIHEPRIVDPPKRSEATTEAIREAFSDARTNDPQPEPTRCHAPAVPSSTPTPEKACPPSPAGPTSSPTTDASATPALATSPAAPPLPIPTATPTSTATETPSPSPSAPTAGEPSASSSAGSPPTTAPAVARSAGPPSRWDATDDAEPPDDLPAIDWPAEMPTPADLDALLGALPHARTFDYQREEIDDLPRSNRPDRDAPEEPPAPPRDDRGPPGEPLEPARLPVPGVQAGPVGPDPVAPAPPAPPVVGGNTVGVSQPVAPAVASSDQGGVYPPAPPATTQPEPAQPVPRVMIHAHGQAPRPAVKPEPRGLEYDPRLSRVISVVPNAYNALRNAGIDSWVKLRKLSAEDLTYTKGLGSVAAVAIAVEANLRDRRADPLTPEPAWAVEMAPKAPDACTGCRGRRVVAGTVTFLDETARDRTDLNAPCPRCRTAEANAWADERRPVARIIRMGADVLLDLPVTRTNRMTRVPLR